MSDMNLLLFTVSFFLLFNIVNIFLARKRRNKYIAELSEKYFSTIYGEISFFLNELLYLSKDNGEISFKIAKAIKKNEYIMNHGNYYQEFILQAVECGYKTAEDELLSNEDFIGSIDLTKNCPLTMHYLKALYYVKNNNKSKADIILKPIIDQHKLSSYLYNNIHNR